MEGVSSTLVQRIGWFITNIMVAIFPRGLLRSLAISMSERHPEDLTRTVTTKNRDLSSVVLPEKIHGFEDLAFLFWTTPMNRGVLRQDFDEAASLYGLIKSSGARRCLEIGRYAGGSTVMIASALALNDGKLTSIDISPRDDKRLRETLEKLGLSDHVDLIVADANTLSLDEPLDLAFIDGDHSYEGARLDHLKWGELVKVGGHIVHHDMGLGRDHATGIPELNTLKKDILHHQQNELTLVSEVGSMVVFQRTAASWTRFNDTAAAA